MIGDITPTEWRTETVEGRRLTRLTDGRSNSYPLYYFVPSVTPDGRYFVFHSERSGEVQLYRLDLGSGEIGQLTDGHTRDAGWAIWCEWHLDGVYTHLSAINPQTGELFYFQGGETWMNYAAFCARVSNTPEGAALMDVHFDPVVLKLVGILQRALPDHTREDIFWGYHFVTGALMNTLARTGRIDRLSDGLCHSDDFMAVKKRIARASAGRVLSSAMRSA